MLSFLGKPFHQAIFGRLRKDRNAAQRASGPSMKTDDSGMRPGLVDKRGRVVSPS